MVVVIDTSALVAVLVSEPERDAVVRATLEAELIAPASVHWEIGNAMSAMLKRKRATSAQVQRALASYATIPIRFVDVDLSLALEIAAEHRVNAYVAYLMTCALTQRAPLLTLDGGLVTAARTAGIQLVEVTP